jgi:lysophospholipase L1-like esterase
MRSKLVPLLTLATCTLALAQSYEPKPNGSFFEKFQPLKAPVCSGLVLKRGDRLAICGDSITEQKKYSRIMEDYLTMCVPELQVTVRQYGWSGERAPGFLARMTNDCLRFKPTVATTCYGMNDHEYRPYEERIGQTYRDSSTAVVEAFKANGVKVIQGSPGCVGRIPFWVKSATGTVDDLNLNLCTLRNIGIEIAQKEKVGFADVFWPMLTAGVAAQKQYGTNYAIAGKDGVHPAWAGHTVMAYAFLKALGLNGDLGVFTVDLKRGKMKASKGHRVVSAKEGEFTISSSRYPFCPCVENAEHSDSFPVCAQDDPVSDNSIRSAMALIPFNQELNRFILVAKNGNAANYQVTWGTQSKSFTAEQLSHGVNLTEEFPANPFSAAFAKVDTAIAAKQAYETRQIKEAFRSSEAKSDMEGVAARTEQERQPLAQAIKAAFVPMTHTINIKAN